MTLHPGASVTNASGAGDIHRTKGVGANKASAAPADGIRISDAFESLSILNARHAVKVARIAAEVHSGTYRVNSAAVGKAMVEAAARVRL